MLREELYQRRCLGDNMIRNPKIGSWSLRWQGRWLSEWWERGYRLGRNTTEFAGAAGTRTLRRSRSALVGWV